MVAAELSKRGFIVSPTSRSAAGADLLVTDQKCKRAYSVQVKTDATAGSFWLIGAKAKETISDTHIYVLVKLRRAKDGAEGIDYFVVPSKALAKVATHDGRFPNVKRTRVVSYQDKWSVFGKAA